jgi:translation initiation factor 1
MGKKKKKKQYGGNMVYSTNPDYVYEAEEEAPLLPGQQNLRIWLEKGGRGGKTASVIKGFEGSDDDLKELAKLLKSSCLISIPARVTLFIVPLTTFSISLACFLQYSCKLVTFSL